MRKITKSIKVMRYDYFINGEGVGALYLAFPKKNEAKMDEFVSRLFLNEYFAYLLGYKNINPITSGCLSVADVPDELTDEL